MDTIAADPFSKTEVVKKRNKNFVEKHMLRGGHIDMKKNTKGRVTMYQLPSGEIVFTARDWSRQRKDLYETFL